jgi:L-asparagine transporter-like permease
MLKRISEIIIGIIMVVFLLGSYGSTNSPQKPLIAYLTDNGILQAAIVIALIFLASRLIAGKSKDYSKSIYSLLVSIFGDPKNKVKANR